MMKSIFEYLSASAEEMIVEADCRDLRNPRKGCTLYMLKKGDTKVVKATVTNITKTVDKSSWYTNKYGRSYDLVCDLSDNEYGIEKYYHTNFGSINYDENDLLQAETHVMTSDLVVTFGTSKDAIEEYLKNKASKKSESLAASIAKLETELADLKAQKDAEDAIINSQLTENKSSEEATILEFEAGGTDWGKTWDEYRKRHNVKPEFEDIFLNLHTIGQYYEELSEKNPEFAKNMDSVWGLLANRTPDVNDDRGLNKSTFDEIIPDLKKLAEHRMGKEPYCTVGSAAFRALDEIKKLK